MHSHFAITRDIGNNRATGAGKLSPAACHDGKHHEPENRTPENAADVQVNSKERRKFLIFLSITGEEKSTGFARRMRGSDGIAKGVWWYDEQHKSAESVK
jgi:hypothetical protein